MAAAVLVKSPGGALARAHARAELVALTAHVVRAEAQLELLLSSPTPPSDGLPASCAETAAPAKLRLVEAHLGSHHRDTVKRIFARPTSHNIEWREVVSLLDAIGTVTHEHNGKLRVLLGPETEVLPAPHGKDVDVQIVVDLRRMLKEAGFAPDGSPPIADQRTRDHGDGQWGEP